MLCISRKGRYSGLSDDPDLSYQQTQPVPALVQILDGTVPARSAPVKADTVPGSIEKYSNQGYCIVQLMMSDMTGRPFPDLMDDLILGPAGMAGRTFRQYLPEYLVPQATTGYRSTGEEVPGKRLICPAMAAAGLWTTPTDLAPLMTAYPARGEGAVIMTNSDAGQGLYYEILRGIASEYGWSSYLPVEKTVVLLETEQMREFEGVYLPGGQIELRFSVDNDHLKMASPANTYHLFPESNTKFFDIDYGFTIDFIRDEGGAVKEAVLDRGGVISMLSRVE